MTLQNKPALKMCETFYKKDASMSCDKTAVFDPRSNRYFKKVTNKYLFLGFDRREEISQVWTSMEVCRFILFLSSCTRTYR